MNLRSVYRVPRGAEFPKRQNCFGKNAEKPKAFYGSFVVRDGESSNGRLAHFSLNRCYRSRRFGNDASTVQVNPTISWEFPKPKDGLSSLPRSAFRG